MMTAEITKMTTTKNTSKIMSEQVLSWTKRIEAQCSEKAMLESLKQSKEFNMTKTSKCRPQFHQIKQKHITQSSRQGIR